MRARVPNEPLDAAIDEYVATFGHGWKPATRRKYAADFGDFLGWLRDSKRACTTASLDFAMLLAYCNHLKTKPAVRGVWRGDREAVARRCACRGIRRPSKTASAEDLAERRALT